MSTFGLASRSVKWMLGTQFVIGVGQFVYSAITARAFTPTEFGSFSAALGLVALLVLLTTTGLPSAILREEALTRTDVAWIRGYALVGGVIAAVLFTGIAPYWILLLQAPDASQFLPLLSVSLACGPLAAVEASLLRRESNPGYDAISFLLAFLLPAAVAVVATFQIREAWVLALATILTPITLGTSSALLRKERYRRAGSTRHRELLGFSGKVSAQNVVFLLIGSAPGWVLSASLGASALGFFSRAATLANTPASAFSTAINRAVQPHWRKMSGSDVTARAMRDTTLLASSMSLPAFAILAVAGPPFTSVWLGPGWDEVARVIPWLAIAGGFSVIFSILATSLEMRSFFSTIRFGQLGLIGGLAIGLGIFLLTRDLASAGSAVLISQTLGLAVLLIAIAKSSRILVRTLVWAVAVPTLWSSGVAAVAMMAVLLSETLGWHVMGSTDLVKVIAGTMAAAAFWLFTFRWQPASLSLATRGVRLPRLLAPVRHRR